MSYFNVISIPSANSSEELQALEEVSQFARTDMGTGQGSWTYRRMQEPEISRELARMASATSLNGCHCITFQPCLPHVAENQDRYVVQTWNLPNGPWSFNLVLDGHLNSWTVSYVLQKLPDVIQNELRSALTHDSRLGIPHISQILRDSITNLDNQLCTQFLQLFPRDFVSLNRMTDAQIQETFENPVCGQDNSEITFRCLGGTTVVLSLTDPLKKNLWIANLGDCHAVLGVRTHQSWAANQVNALHALIHNPTEGRRIKSEHPAEEHAIKSNRIVGFLEPTRAVGDIWLKIPSIYTSRILSKVDQDWISAGRLQEYARHIVTPPYISNVADVYHQQLPNSPSFLILATDGLSDLYEGIALQEMVQRWVNVVGREFDLVTSATNPALSLLRDSLGGQDLESVSRNLTVEMDSERWMDDTTCVVQQFH